MSVFITNEKGVRTEFHKGCVITTRERNYRDDSDFYAVVWDEEKQEVRSFEYATTRFYTYDNDAHTDATPEILAKAQKWSYAQTRKRVFDAYLGSLKKVEKGDKVRVLRGRKAPIGTEGIVFWVGEENTYGGYSRWSQTKSTKIGIATSDKRNEKGQYTDVVWTYSQNCEAIAGCKFKLSEIKRILKNLRRNAVSHYNAMGSGMIYV